MRLWIPALTVISALVASACGDDDVDLSAVTEELEAEADSGADDAPGPADDSESGAPDPEQPGDDDSDPSAKSGLEAEAKSGTETLSKFFEGGVSTTTEECMIEGLLADPELLEAVIAGQPDGDLSDLSDEDQVAAVDLGLSCVTVEELSESIKADFDADLASQALAGDAADCISRRLTDDSDPDRSQLLLALVAMDEEASTTPEQRDLIVGLMTGCISPRFMVDAALQSVVDNPLVGAALDRACLESAVEAPGYMDRFWELFVDNSDVEFEALPLEQQRTIIGPFFECISFGGVIAATAAEEGVALSSETIACIDDAIDSAALVDVFLSGAEFDETGLIGAILPCLSPEELGSLG